MSIRLKSCSLICRLLRRNAVAVKQKLKALLTTQTVDRYKPKFYRHLNQCRDPLKGLYHIPLLSACMNNMSIGPLSCKVADATIEL
jgi:hypothetical protein